MKYLKLVTSGFLTGAILLAGMCGVQAFAEPSSNPSSVESSYVEIDQRLKPYLQAMQEVNTELGENYFFLPEENKQFAYEQIHQMSLEEFKDFLRASHQENVEIINSNQGSMTLIPYDGHVDDAINLLSDNTEVIHHPNGTVEEITTLSDNCVTPYSIVRKDVVGETKLGIGTSAFRAYGIAISYTGQDNTFFWEGINKLSSVYTEGTKHFQKIGNLWYKYGTATQTYANVSGQGMIVDEKGFSNAVLYTQTVPVYPPQY